MDGYVIFWAHDVLANCESFIGDFSPEHLAELEREGMVLVGEREDGSREIVPASEVKEPENGETGKASIAGLAGGEDVRNG